MKSTTETFQELVENGTINPEDFYVIELRADSINLQGYFSSDKVKKYLNPSAEFTDSGFVFSEYKYGEITIEIVLSCNKPK